MKLLPWILLIIGSGLVYVFWPEKEDFSERKQQYETEIAILKVEKAHISSRFDSIAKASKDKGKSDSLKIARQDSKIQGLEKLSKERRVKVETIIEDNPDLLSFVETQQEVITELKVQVDTLKASVAFHQKVNDELVQTHEAEERIDQQLHEKKDNRIVELEKEVKKQRRGKLVAKILVPVVAVASFLAGSQL